MRPPPESRSAKVRRPIRSSRSKPVHDKNVRFTFRSVPSGDVDTYPHGASSNSASASSSSTDEARDGVGSLIGGAEVGAVARGLEQHVGAVGQGVAHVLP